jgi:hypothetical protein
MKIEYLKKIYTDKLTVANPPNLIKAHKSKEKNEI